MPFLFGTYDQINSAGLMAKKSNCSFCCVNFVFKHVVQSVLSKISLWALFGRAFCLETNLRFNSKALILISGVNINYIAACIFVISWRAVLAILWKMDEDSCHMNFGNFSISAY